MIDFLIQVDGWDYRNFLDYKRLEELVIKSDGIESEDYLLELLSIARQAIPPDFRTMHTEVIDTNVVDPNKVIEG